MRLMFTKALLFLGMAVICWHPASAETITQADKSEIKTLTIADFSEDKILGRIAANAGVTLALTEKDAVSGKRCLEVRTAPFSIHKNQWPTITFVQPNFFQPPLDLSAYSKISVTIRNMTDNPGEINIQGSSLPYNDGGRNLELGGVFTIPGGATVVCDAPVTVFKKNDPSSIKFFLIMFPPNEFNAVYRIESIQAVYDPAVGARADELKADVLQLKQQFGKLRKEVDWKAIPFDARPFWEEKYSGLKKMVETLDRDYALGMADEAFQGKYAGLKQEIDEIAKKMGEFLFAGKKSFVVWEIDPYINVLKTEAPGLRSGILEKVDMQMAQNEFRDKVFMVSPCEGQDVKLEVRFEGPDALPRGAVVVEEAIYLKEASAGQETGKAVYRLEWPLVIPKGESRQVRLRFDTRYTPVKPGLYLFKVILRDLNTRTAKTIPGTLKVFNFQLPSYDVLANNSYAEFENCEFSSGDLLAKAVAHMKMYGLNRVFIHPVDSIKTVLDADGDPAGFDTALFVNRLQQIQKAWQAAPGDENLKFIICLPGEIRPPSYNWNKILPAWYACLKDTTKKLGISDQDLIFVINDEPGEPTLAKIDVPLAEAIKNIDPNAKFTSNTSTAFSDPATKEKFVKLWDIFQPALNYLKTIPGLRDWIQASGKTLWAYQCDTELDAKGRNMYEYYRVYGWDLVKYGLTGTGVWTYCAQGNKVWENPNAGKGSTSGAILVLKHLNKDEVVHFRRYEIFREGADDYRYIWKLREVAGNKGPQARNDTEKLIREAVADVTSNVFDTTRCETWRLRIAQEILNMQ